MAGIPLLNSPSRQDPRAALAAAMLNQGLQGGPVQNPVQGAGRLAKALSGAYIARSLQDEEEAKRLAAQQTLAQALQAAQGAPTGVSNPATELPDVLGGSAAAGAPDMSPRSPQDLQADRLKRFTTVLSGNPDTAPYAAQVQLAQFLKDPEKPTILSPGQAAYGPNGERLYGVPAKTEPPKAPTIKDFTVGNEIVTKQWDPATGQWNEVSRAPRFKPSETKGPKSDYFDESGAPTLNAVRAVGNQIAAQFGGKFDPITMQFSVPKENAMQAQEAFAQSMQNLSGYRDRKGDINLPAIVKEAIGTIRQPTTPPPPNPNQQAVLDQAKQAIAQGADPAAVRSRLTELGVDPALLGQ